MAHHRTRGDARIGMGRREGRVRGAVGTAVDLVLMARGSMTKDTLDFAT